MELLRLWLDRSRGHPLSISISKDRRSLHNCSAILQYIELFRDYVSQWQIVTISADSAQRPTPGRTSRKIVPFVAPRLRHLDLRSSDQTIATLSIEFAPALEDLLCSIPPGALSTSAVPWSRLRTIEITSLVSPDDIYELLRIGPCIEVCIVTTFADAPTQCADLLPRPVLEHRVRELNVVTYNDITPLLDSLELPAMQDLSISICLGGWTVTDFNVLHQSTLSLLQRSHCKLKRLWFLDYWLSPNQLIALLECVSAELEMLTLLNLRYYLDVNDDVRSLFTYDLSSGTPLCLAPKLKSLTLEQCVQCSPGRLAVMVESRCPPQRGGNTEHLVASLEDFTATLPDELELDMSRVMRLADFSHIHVQFDGLSEFDSEEDAEASSSDVDLGSDDDA